MNPRPPNKNPISFYSFITCYLLFCWNFIVNNVRHAKWVCFGYYIIYDVGSVGFDLGICCSTRESYEVVIEGDEASLICGIVTFSLY